MTKQTKQNGGITAQTNMFLTHKVLLLVPQDTLQKIVKMTNENTSKYNKIHTSIKV